MQRVFKEKPPRLDLVFQRRNAPIYFVTFNTHTRARLLATPEVHQAFIEYCRRAAEFRIGVGDTCSCPITFICLFALESDARRLWAYGLGD